METMSRQAEIQPQKLEKTKLPSNRRRGIIAAAVVIAGAVAWYAFRPELLFIDQEVNEDFPITGAIETDGKIASGTFHSVAHETKGTAAIYELAGGKRVLRLAGFETSNGPDVRVLLGKAPDASDDATVKTAGYVELGSLKGNVGDQNYEIPAEVELADFNSVTIWCHRFSVNFGTAPLKVN
jgi:hypothetical protein